MDLLRENVLPSFMNWYGPLLNFKIESQPAHNWVGYCNNSNGLELVILSYIMSYFIIK